MIAVFGCSFMAILPGVAGGEDSLDNGCLAVGERADDLVVRATAASATRFDTPSWANTCRASSHRPPGLHPHECYRLGHRLHRPMPERLHTWLDAFSKSTRVSGRTPSNFIASAPAWDWRICWKTPMSGISKISPTQLDFAVSVKS